VWPDSRADGRVAYLSSNAPAYLRGRKDCCCSQSCSGKTIPRVETLGPAQTDWFFAARARVCLISRSPGERGSDYVNRLICRGSTTGFGGGPERVGRCRWQNSVLHFLGDFKLVRKRREAVQTKNLSLLPISRLMKTLFTLARSENRTAGGRIVTGYEIPEPSGGSGRSPRARRRLAGGLDVGPCSDSTEAIYKDAEQFFHISS